MAEWVASCPQGYDRMRRESLASVKAPGVNVGSQRFGRLLRRLAGRSRDHHVGVLLMGGHPAEQAALAWALAQMRNQTLLELDLSHSVGPETGRWKVLDRGIGLAERNGAMLLVHAGDTLFGPAPGCAPLPGRLSERLLARVQAGRVMVVLAGAERYCVGLEACWPRIRLGRPASRIARATRRWPMAQAIPR